MNAYSIKDKSYLALQGVDIGPIDEAELDMASRERLSLAGVTKLDEESSIKEMQEIAEGSNIVDLLMTDLLKDREVKSCQIVCDGRLKAQLVVDDKWVIELFENATAHYIDEQGQYKLITRGRVADQLVKDNSYKGYIAISYLEMEYSKNEAEYLLKVLNPVFN